MSEAADSNEPADEGALTRRDLVDRLRKEVGSRTEAKSIVTSFFNHMEKAIVDKGMAKIHNFGRFETVEKKERMGCNPRNGENKVISARTVVRFRPSNKLRNAVRYNLSKPEDD